MLSPQAARTTPVILLYAAVACSNGDSPRPDTPQPAPAADDTGLSGPEPDTQSPEPIQARPATLQDTLLIEGMPEVVSATLVRAPETFAVPFSTYLPEGMNVEFQTEPAGTAVRFIAAFAGVVERQAYMQVLAFAPGTTAEQARGNSSAFLAGKAVRPVDAPAWALDAQGFDYPDDAGAQYTGRILLARHGPHFFQLVQHYPPEYGDGLGPRFHRIHSHWRWEDTGEPLTR